MTNFDCIIPRKGTHSIKYDTYPGSAPIEDLLPLWVADMDFSLPEEVLQAIQSEVSRGIFGYGFAGSDYAKAVCGWFSRHFGWDPPKAWLIKTPGVIYAVCLALQAYTQPGDAVLIQEPAYHWFEASVHDNRRRLVTSQLVYQNQSYHIDFEDFERKILSENVKLFILCNPHNPVGRVWTREELTRLGEICLKHHVLVVSDEIHCDFTYPGHTHTVFASLSLEFANNSVICTAPTKTFNMAGLKISNIFIANDALRAQFQQVYRTLGLPPMNNLGYTACRAAYTYGDAWLDELRQYLQGNLALLRTFLQENLPEIRLIEPEGTYLAWLDCSGLGYTPEALTDLLLHEAHVWLEEGQQFGPGAEPFQRINLACPRAVLQQALERMERAINQSKSL